MTYKTKRPVFDLRTIAEVEGAGVKAGKHAEWKEQIIVPPLPQSELRNCSLINIDYFIQVRVCLYLSAVSSFFIFHITHRTPLNPISLNTTCWLKCFCGQVLAWRLLLPPHSTVRNKPQCSDTCQSNLFLPEKHSDNFPEKDSNYYWNRKKIQLTPF